MTQTVKSIFLYSMAILFLIGMALRIEALDVVIFNEWIARDFDRAFNIIDGEYIPLAGPEVNTGGRLPGPFMYFFLTLPLLINYSYYSLFLFNFILNIASIIGLFFILKKYFDIYIAGFVTGLVSINFLSIIAVAFPINPSFLFPFITLFLWLLFEFSLKRNTRVIPYIALIFALAVQFHYSIATYFLIPVITGVIFKIKIPLKRFLASLIIIIICVSPYAIHKSKFYTPQNAGEKATLTKQDFSSPWVNFKVFTLLHTFHYLSQIQTQPLGEPQLPRPFSLTMSLLTGMAFYILFFLIFRKYRNNDWRSCKKEILALIIFFVPALIYGIVNPMTNHLWYGFIFIVPQALLLAVLSQTVCRSLLFKSYETAYTGLILFLFFVAGFSMDQHARSVLKGIKENLFGNQIVNGTFKNTQLVLSVISDRLNLRADDLFEKVYFNGYHILSKRRLEFLDDAFIGNNKGRMGSTKSCYFIFDKTKNYSGVKNREGRIIDSFFKDPSIRILSKQELSLSPWGFQEILKIIQYQPIHNQSCYNNTFNPFVTTPSIRKLLIASKDIHFEDKDVGFKVLYEDFTYDSNGNLELMNASYAVNNQISQSPFRFDLNITKRGEGYSIRGEIELYSFFRAPNFDIKRMDILIEKPKEGRPDQGILPKPPSANFEKYQINILSPETPANFLNVNTTHHFNYNQRWHRETQANINLKKGDFNIFLNWTLNCGQYPLEPPCPLKPEKEFVMTAYKQVH